MEAEAHQFASGLLIPLDDIRPVFRSSRRIDLPLLAHLKPQRRVSMQSLVFVAKDLGLLTDGQAQTIWKQFSAKKYKLREPPELDFALEPTSLGKGVINAHLKQLGYTQEELAKALVLHVDDLRELYGLEQPRGGLRIVT